MQAFGSLGLLADHLSILFGVGWGRGSTCQHSSYCRWIPPVQGHFKLNCDANFSQNGALASLAVILRDWQGNLVDGATSVVHVSSTLQGEARAVELACAFSQTLNVRYVHLENDNKYVIELGVFELVPPWDCQAIFHDIRTARSRCHISFSWSPRNRAAHWLA